MNGSEAIQLMLGGHMTVTSYKFHSYYPYSFYIEHILTVAK